MTSLLCHFLFLVLVTSAFTRTRGENVTEHLTMKKQGDGPLVMSSDIGETQYNFTDWQLDADLIKILEGSERRLEFSGVLKGDKDFRVISRSVWAEVTGENTPDDEDLFRIYRKLWEELENIEPTRLRRTKQAELLIASVHCPLVYNFFIENDGRIFEGLGWDNVSYGFSGGLGDRALVIVFVNRREPNPKPSEAAIRAYESLVRHAICTGRLPTDYKLIPYHLIWDLASDRWSTEFTNYERNQMRDWNAYTDNVDSLFPPESEVDLAVVSREEWLGVRPNSTIYSDMYPTTALEHPFSIVKVSNFGPRCFRDCGNILKWIADIEGRGMRGWYRPFNFIITESGRVYEGIGWNHTYKWYEDRIPILFLGSFDTYSPRRPAFNAFIKIIDEGLRNGKIIPDYQIRASEREDQGLYQEIKKMDRFCEE